MNKSIKIASLIFCLSFVLFTLSIYTQTVTSPPPQPADQKIELIKKQLQADNPSSNQQIVEQISINLHEKSEEALLRDLGNQLSLAELKKLYKILIEAKDHEWTENFSEKVWQLIALKIKLQSPAKYNNPRIYLIAVISGEKAFDMVLSDGSIWKVGGYLSGDPSVDLTIIRSLLGQYTETEKLNEPEDYSYRISALGFPEIHFNGYMMADKMTELFLKEKNLYWFGELYH